MQDEYYDLESAVGNKQSISFASSYNIPNIPDCLTEGNELAIMPEGFTDIVTAEVDDNEIVLTFLKPENPYMDTVSIPMALWNMEKAKTNVCKFILEESTIRNGVDYFNSKSKDSKLVLNVNQMLYLILHHRLSVFKQYPKHWVGLIKSDIKNLGSFIDYVLPNTYNAKLKVKHTYAIIKHQSINRPLGEYCDSTGFNETEWTKLLADLNISISSESSMSKKNKVVILPNGVEYKSVGYKFIKGDNKSTIVSVFPPKQNLPARLKSHILNNAYELQSPDAPIYLQNLKLENGFPVPIHNCFKEVLVVFDAMDSESKRFVAGEAEASNVLAETLVHIVQEVMVDIFEPEVNLKEGMVVSLKDKHSFVIGLNEDREPILLKGLKSFKVLNIITHGISGMTSIKMDVIMCAGNGRIISDTGIKCVTKIKPNLGTIEITRNVNEVLDLSHFTPSTRKFLEASELTAQMSIPATKVDRHAVDLIVGMNAVKGHSNTIALAQATFAVKHGYYVPSEKMGFSGLLNTLDVTEINAAAQSLPEFKFIDEFGQTRKVFFGIAYIQYTELGNLYTTFKKQSFMFESGKNIRYNDPALADHIWNKYLDKDSVDACKEFTKILNDDKAYLAKKENDSELESSLPIYSVATLRQNKIFAESDLILAMKNMFESASKLLDENFNKGFYIDLSKYPGYPVIRIPSAKILNMLTGKLKNGYITYHEIVINISKILLHIIGTPSKGNKLSLPLIHDLQGKRTTAYTQYMSSIKGTLYSSEDSSQMMIQSLIKPQIPGIGMKQVIEHRLPSDTIVIMDDTIYRKMYKIASSHEDGTINENFLQDFVTKDPLEILYNDCPRVLAIRHPSLWQKMLLTPKVWDRKAYALYLKLEHNINLNDYLSSHLNRDIVLINPSVAMDSKSDSDGDILPLVCLDREGQELLRNFQLTKVTQAEEDWIAAYTEGEYEANTKLKLNSTLKHPHVYEVFYTTMHDTVKTTSITYPKFLLTASVTKGNIGSATLDIWALTLILQCYKTYCEQNNMVYTKDGKVISKLTHKITEDDIIYLNFIYTRLVQERVVEGIKWGDGDKTSFKMYYLREISKDTNIESVQKQLREDYKVSVPNINKLLYVIKFAADCGLLQAARNFISLYNKGKAPTDPASLLLWEDFIQQNSYFGSLIKPIYDIRKNIAGIKATRIVAAKDNLKESFSALDSISFD